jgi:hypothetical protein
MGKLAAAIKRNVPAITALEQQTILLYGREKIGKSSLAAAFSRPLFFDFEGGLRNIECDYLPIPKWSHFVRAVELCEQENNSHDIRVVDTVSRAWEQCRDHVLHVNGWAHEQEGGYGRGYDAIRDEFRRVFDRLLRLPQGCIFIAHDITEEITKPAKVVQYTHARLDKRCRAIVEPAVEMILFADTETDQGVTRRVLRTKRTEYHEAGDRSGRLPETIDLSYDALRSAYSTQV